MPLSENDIDAIRRLEAQIPLKDKPLIRGKLEKILENIHIQHKCNRRKKLTQEEVKDLLEKTSGKTSPKRTLQRHWGLMKLYPTYEIQRSTCQWN